MYRYPPGRFEGVPLVTPNMFTFCTVVLFQVHLSYLHEREGGWEAVQDWMDSEEKQRMSVSVVCFKSYMCLYFLTKISGVSVILVHLKGSYM